MIPGATIFLYLLPLAAAPVIFHLLMRRQRKKMLFSTKMFFHRVSPRLTIHRKLREVLLLASRVLLIIFLLMALAHLTITGIGNIMGLGGNQAAVVIIDNSASMTGTIEGGEGMKLKTAIEGARTLLTNMEEGSKAGVVLLVGDPKTGNPGGMTSEKRLLLDYIDKIRPTEATGIPAGSIMRAMSLLKEAAPAGGGSIHVFTDLQETEWKQQQIGAGGLQDNVNVFFHRIPTASTGKPNVCVVSAKTSSRRILPQQPYNVEVLLRNDGAEAIEVRVNRNDSEHAVADGIRVTIAGGEKKIVKLGFRSRTPGRHWTGVWIDGDGFDGDNRASVSYICEPKGNIYFVGDEKSGEFGLLPLALSPYGDGRYTSLVPSFSTLAQLTGRIEQKEPMLVVLKWSDVCALDAKTDALLQKYTQDGGNLLVLPAVTDAKSFGAPPAWLGVTVGKINEQEKAQPLVVPNGMSEFWSDIRDTSGRVNFGGTFVKRYYPLSLRPNAKYDSLLSAGKDQVVMAIGAIGRGQVTVSGMAFAGRRKGSREWSTLPRKKVFPVMVQPIALGAVSSLANDSISLVAGKAPRLSSGNEDNMNISTLVGDQVEWSGPRDQAPELVRGGAYIVRVGRREMCLSVIPSDTEGANAFIDGDKVAAMGSVTHEVRDLSDEEDFRDELESSVAGTDLYLPFLLLAVAFLMVEGLLGSPSLKQKKKLDGGAHDVLGQAEIAQAVLSGREDAS